MIIVQRASVHTKLTALQNQDLCVGYPVKIHTPELKEYDYTWNYFNLFILWYGELNLGTCTFQANAPSLGYIPGSLPHGLS